MLDFTFPISIALDRVSFVNHCKLVFIVAAVALLSAAAFGQSLTATILGTVSDSSGGVIVGANIKVTNSNTGVTAWRGTSGNAGEYVAPLLPIGSYDVSAEQPGFKKVRITGVVLALDQHAQVNLLMTPGEVVQSVTVSGDVAAIHLDTNTSSVGTVITPAQVRDLPIYNNDATNLLALVNGVVNGNGSAATSVSTWQMSINGSRTLNTEVTLDGTSVIENVTGQISALPPPDALEEMRVMTSAYTAENGRTSGGTISVAVRSGTNVIHGSLYAMERNEDMDANNFFNNLKGVRRPLDRYNQFGGTLSGPVRFPKLYNGKNKTFFLYNYQNTLTRAPNTVTETVPGAAFKSGDFSAASIKVYDPLTGTSPSPFPNNVIPVTRIDSAAAKIMGLVPLPNAAGTLDLANSRSINNFVWPQSPVNTGPRHSAKLDHAFTDKIRIFGSVFAWASNSMPTKTFNNALDTASQSSTNGYDASAGYTHLISPTLFTDVRFGFYRWVQIPKSDGTGTNVLQTLGIGNAPMDVPPNLQITNWTTMGPSAAGSGSLGASNTFQWTGTITKVLMSHTIKAGVQFRKSQYNSFNPTSYPNGEYSFTGGITNKGGVGGNAVDALADFLLGEIASAQYELPQPETGRRNWNMAAFVQDDWKATPRLTINVGLRWEYENPIKNVNDILSRVDLVSGQLLWAGHNASDTANLSTTKLNLGPRLGLAYSLGPKTVIRTAFGIFHSQIMSNLGGAVMYPGYDIVQNFPANGSTPQPFKLAQGMPLTAVNPLNPLLALQSATLANPLAAGASSVFAQVNPLPGIIQWNFGIQQDLGFKTIGEANYIGNHGLHLPLMFNTNLPPFAASDELTLTGIATVTQAARPLPLFSATAGFYDCCTSSYDSLQLSARRQFSSTLSFQVGYTWSKSIDDGSGTANFSHRGSALPNQGQPLDSQFPDQPDLLRAGRYAVEYFANQREPHRPEPASLGSGIGRQRDPFPDVRERAGNSVPDTGKLIEFSAETVGADRLFR